MPKRPTTNNYRRGQILLKYLQKSGQMLMSGSFCYAYFIYQQIELSLRRAVERVGEINTDYATIKLDLSEQKFTKYHFDLSALSLDELECLRNMYVLGDRWSEQSNDSLAYNRGFTVTLILSLSEQLSEQFVQLAKEENVPLHTVISIFYGLLDKDHQNIDLMVESIGSESSQLDIANGIAHKIHDIFLEYLSLVALSVTIELVWIIAVIDDEKKEKKEKESSILNFLRRHCFHLCCDEQFLQLKGEPLQQYLQDRYLCVKEAFYWFGEFLVGSAKAGGKHIGFLRAEKSGDLFREEEFSSEEYDLGSDIAGKLYQKMFVHKYSLRGHPNNIIGYLSKIIYYLKLDYIKELYKNQYGVSGRTLCRYLAECPEKFTKEVKADVEQMQQVVKNIELQKEKNSRHVKDYHLTQNKLIEELMASPDIDHDEMSGRQNNSEVKDVKLKKLSRRAYIDRLKRLEEEGIIMPDHVEMSGKLKVKYYYDSTTNIARIAEAISNVKRRKKRKKEN